MSFSWRTHLPISLLVTMACSQSAMAVTPTSSFTSAEHIMIGNSVSLRFSDTDPGQKAAVLELPNGLSVSYGEIVTIGDFYEIPDEPVSRGVTEAERRSRFLGAFSSFALNSAAKEEAMKILDVAHTEQRMVDDALKNGQSIDTVYAQIGRDFDRQFNCITGGGCNTTTWWLDPGRYLTLANMDYDHFGSDALETYQIGHQIALEQAASAKNANDPSKLKLAYAINAFACHFLSDRFSSGHIRTPRVELSEQTTPQTVGSLLSSYMHAEENSQGLHVHNARGDRWTAYGDKSYFKDATETHKNHVIEAMQASADQVFAAYQQGTSSVEDNMIDLIPYPDEVADKGNIDISPLFYWDNATKTLYRRSDMSNVFDRHWTNSWWGWSTLAELKRERGLSEEAQATLARSDLREKALQDGLITEPAIVAYAKQLAKT